jgi:hypothetical protein
MFNNSKQPTNYIMIRNNFSSFSSTSRNNNNNKAVPNQPSDASVKNLDAALLQVPSTFSLEFDPDKKLRTYKQINPLCYLTRILGDYFFIDDYKNYNSNIMKSLLSLSWGDAAPQDTLLQKRWNSDSVYRMPLKFWYRFKSQPCRRWNTEGKCKYGRQCWYYHNEEERIRLDWDEIGCVTTHRDIYSLILNTYDKQRRQQQQQLRLNNNSSYTKTTLNVFFCSFGCKNEECCNHHCLFYQSLVNFTERPIISLVSSLHPTLLQKCKKKEKSKGKNEINNDIKNETKNCRMVLPDKNLEHCFLVNVGNVGNAANTSANNNNIRTPPFSEHITQFSPLSPPTPLTMSQQQHLFSPSSFPSSMFSPSVPHRYVPSSLSLSRSPPTIESNEDIFTQFYNCCKLNDYKRLPIFISMTRK